MADVMDLAAAKNFAERLRGLGSLHQLDRAGQAIVLLADALAASEQARVDTLEAHRITLVDLADSEVRVQRLEQELNNMEHPAPFCQRKMLGSRAPCTCGRAAASQAPK